MLRQFRERVRPVKNLLLTTKDFLVNIPLFIWRRIRIFYYNFTRDYDLGYAVLHGWIFWSVYLACQILAAYTSLFDLLPEVFFGSLDFCIYSLEYSVAFAVQCWLPCITATTIITGAVYSDYKEKKEARELQQSYIDEEDDMVVDWYNILPVPGARLSWGERDEDIVPVENFTAPTVYVKISGIIGRCGDMHPQEIVPRVNKAIKNKLAPGAVNGPFPWKSMSVNMGVALIYVQFKTIDEATKCFKMLDGLTYDGRSSRRHSLPHRGEVESAVQTGQQSTAFATMSSSVNYTSLSNLTTFGLLPSNDLTTTTTTTSLLDTSTQLIDSCDDLNISCSCHTEYTSYEGLERVTLGLVAVPVIMFGIMANVTSMRIFTHRIMSGSSINWYLAVLSASDTLILVSAFFVLSLPRFGEYLTWWRANYISYSVTPYMYGLMMTAQTCSVFMTVGVSVHRYIGVCHPYKSVEWLPKKRVTTFIIGLLTFSVVFNTTRFFEVHISNVCYRANIDYYMPSLQPTALRMNDLYRQIFFGWVYTIVMYVIPFTLLIALNSMVLAAVRRSRRMHMVSQCGAESEEFSKKAERKERQTSIMLIAIVLLFIACNTLAFVCNIMENMGAYGEVYNTLVTSNNLLVIINASCNICVYMLFSDKYRMLLRYYIFCDWSRQGELLVSSVLT